MNEARRVALVVEDDARIRRFVHAALDSEGWLVEEALTREDALARAGALKPAVVLLDLGLPDGDGVGFLRAFRGWSSAPVIVLSARTDEAVKVAALDAGADDYLTKPFGAAELLARMRVHLRRQDGAATLPSVVCFGDIRVDMANRRVWKSEHDVRLTPIEFRLLEVLVANLGRVITQRQLLQEVWGAAYTDRVQYLRVHMSHLRHKLENTPTQPRHLLTETAIGYRLVP